MRLLLCLVIVAVALSSPTGPWQLDISPLPFNRASAIENAILEWRVDVSGPETVIKSAVVCASDKPLVPRSTCSSPGMFRSVVRQPNRTMVIATQPGLYYVLDVVLPGDHCVREIPSAVAAVAAVTEKISSAVVQEQQQQQEPWYYYSIVIVGACIVGLAFLVVVAGIWKGKHYPAAVSFVDVYHSRRRRNQQLAAQTLGLHQYDPEDNDGGLME